MMRRWMVRGGILTLLVLLLIVGDVFRRAPRVSLLEKKNPKVTHWMEVRQKQAGKAGRKWNVDQSWVSLGEIARPARQAVVAAEDASFFHHDGFDFFEMKEALKRDWKKKRWARGASTISQQLAKNLWLSPRKSLWRKAEEAILTVRLERSLKKERILELYLNVAEWGPGVFGIEAASWRYLGKSSGSLSAEEGALLAAMLPNPFRLNPVRNARAVERRQAIILRRMRRLGWLAPPAPAPGWLAVPRAPGMALEGAAPPVEALDGEAPGEGEVEHEEEAEEIPPDAEAPPQEVPGPAEPVPTEPPAAAEPEDQPAEGS